MATKECSFGVYTKVIVLCLFIIHYPFCLNSWAVYFLSLRRSVCLHTSTMEPW